MKVFLVEITTTDEIEDNSLDGYLDCELFFADEHNILNIRSLKVKKNLDENSEEEVNWDSAEKIKQ